LFAVNEAHIKLWADKTKGHLRRVLVIRMVKQLLSLALERSSCCTDKWNATSCGSGGGAGSRQSGQGTGLVTARRHPA